MRKKFWDKRIPTLFGLFIITVAVGITTFLVNRETLFQINAGPTQQPENVRITNITHSSFSVSYTTEGEVTGSVNYGKDQALGQSGLDDQDKESGSLKNHKVHSITIDNLTPQTTYYFTITSGQDSYMNNNKPFEAITGPTLSESPSTQTAATGKLILPNGSPPKEAIIYLTTEGSQVTSALVKTDGTYSLPLNLVRTSNLSSYYNFTKDSEIKMLAFGDSLTSGITSFALQVNPVPTVTLSQNYDFRINESPNATLSASLEGFPSFDSSSSASTKEKGPQILTPEKDQGFTDQQPTFKGTGLPNEDVEIIIHSDEQIQTQVLADKNGNWNFRPSNPLSPGSHTITIITRDASGVLRTITQTFMVFALGTQVAEAATPSATLTPTPTSVPITTTSPTQFPTPTDALSLSPSASPSAKPLPPAGNPSIITAGIVGIFISFMGGLLFLLTRRGI